MSLLLTKDSLWKFDEDESFSTTEESDDADEEKGKLPGDFQENI
jgi:hypothetical protein